MYDTGGLSLKPSTAMAGMKCDMGGAAAAVGAALALAAGKAKEAVVCAAALAENAIGPGAYRPDDILTMHSGKHGRDQQHGRRGASRCSETPSPTSRATTSLDAVIDAATLDGRAA